MSVWDDLGLTSGLERPRRTRSADKTQTWIKKFTDYLNEQKNLLKTVEQKPDQSKKTRGKRNKAHTFWLEDKSVYVFEPRYGTKLVYLQPGKNQITAPTIEEMQGRIDKLIQITKSGDLNEPLREAAVRTPKAKNETTVSAETGTTSKSKPKA